MSSYAEHLEDKLLQLYEAARHGNVSTLLELIESDPQILDRVSIASKPDTPLHVSALAGHLDFTIALLEGKPQLASRLDSYKCSPLHLASAEGHTQIVKALLQENKDVCLVGDAEGRIPLHLAAIRGKVEIMQELYDAQPDSILQEVNGDSVLHLCIQYNQLEALRRLVTLVNEDQLVNFRDRGGNTILHLAVMLRQSETVEYLVSIPKIKAEVNALNRFGISALTVLEHSARDSKYFEIRDILIRAVAVGENRIHAFPTQQESLLSVTVVDENNIKTDPGADENNIKTDPGAVRPWFTSCYTKFKKYLKERDDWVEKRHKTLMLVATLTATMSFQIASNPPGGVWQQDYNGEDVKHCYNIDSCRAGSAVMASIYPYHYLWLIICATLSFVASVSVVLLAISRLPLKNKFCTWLLTIAMVCSINFTTVTYLLALWLVVPAGDVFDKFYTTFKNTLFFWLSLLGLVTVVDIIRLFLWLAIGLFWLTRIMLRQPPRQPTVPPVSG